MILIGAGTTAVTDANFLLAYKASNGLSISFLNNKT
jgi:hypothetical protein